jgi:iron complex outermembrane receptor protein
MSLSYRALMSAASALALTAAPAIAQPPTSSDAGAANPQMVGTDQAGEIVVTGLRASLSSAQNIRRNAPSIVDSIVSEDIGKFPDNTVSDALQRVTGVQVNRGRGETSAVVIRGLPNIATLINGREVFTGTGRGVALQDIPAELLAGVDVYKTNTPDLVEGGLVGTVDIRLHRPFDFKGLRVAGSARAVYSDQADKWSYLGGGLISNRWDTGIGEIGLMAGASYNRRRYRDDTAFDFVYSGAPIPTPDTVGGIYTVGDRRRTAYNVAAQWKPSDKLEFYADGVFTQYKERWGVNFFIGLPKAGNVTSVTARSDGSGLAQSSTTQNAYTLTSKQAFENKTTTWQGDVGAKWHVADDTLVTTELVYNHSRIPNRNIIVDTSFNAPTLNVDYDVGGTPHVDITGVDITDASQFRIRTLFDNHQLDMSRQWAWRADLQHDVDGDFLKNFKLGVRYTTRRASSQATASVFIGNPDPNGTPLSALPGFATLSPSGLVNGKLGIDRFVLGNENWMLANPDKIRAVFGQPAGDRPFTPSLAFFDDEKTYAFYGQAGYGFDLGSVPVDGTGGVRVVNTVENLHGNGVAGRSNYLNFLPTASLRAKLTDKLQARLVFTQTISRPDFSALNPLVTYVPSGQTGSQTYAGTGGGGNPDLKPIKSTNYDAALEYYFSSTSSITATAFYHKIKGYIQSYAAPEQNGTNADGTPAIYLVTRPRNAGSGKLYGAELAFQQFFDFLPGALSGLGAQVNGTYLVGTAENTATHEQERLNQVSRYSANVVAIYEKYGISARLAYNWRSSFIDSRNIGGSQGSLVRVKPIQQLDFSGSYDVTNWLTVTVDATNLLNRTYHDRFTGASLTPPNAVSNTPRDTRTYDRTFEFGARVKF